MVKKASCPSCFYEIELDDGVILGEIVECPDCSIECEVIKLDGEKATLQVSEEVEDDWGE